MRKILLYISLILALIPVYFFIVNIHDYFATRSSINCLKENHKNIALDSQRKIEEFVYSKVRNTDSIRTNFLDQSLTKCNVEITETSVQNAPRYHIMFNEVYIGKESGYLTINTRFLICLISLLFIIPYILLRKLIPID